MYVETLVGVGMVLFSEKTTAVEYHLVIQDDGSLVKQDGWLQGLSRSEKRLLTEQFDRHGRLQISDGRIVLMTPSINDLMSPRFYFKSSFEEA